MKGGKYGWFPGESYPNDFHMFSLDKKVCPLDIGDNPKPF